MFAWMGFQWRPKINILNIAIVRLGDLHSIHLLGIKWNSMSNILFCITFKLSSNFIISILRNLNIMIRTFSSKYSYTFVKLHSIVILFICVMCDMTYFWTLNISIKHFFFYGRINNSPLSLAQKFLKGKLLTTTHIFLLLNATGRILIILL